MSGLDEEAEAKGVLVSLACCARLSQELLGQGPSGWIGLYGNLLRVVRSRHLLPTWSIHCTVPDVYQAYSKALIFVVNEMMWADSKTLQFIVRDHYKLYWDISLCPMILAGGWSFFLVEKASDSCLSRRVPRTDPHVRLSHITRTDSIPWLEQTVSDCVSSLLILAFPLWTSAKECWTTWGKSFSLWQ